MAAYYSFTISRFGRPVQHWQHYELSVTICCFKRVDVSTPFPENNCAFSERWRCSHLLFKFQERVTAPLMCYQFKSKAILPTCLCSVDTSALRLHCKAIEGSYSRDRVSQFDNRAECRLWHKPGCSGCRWHSSGRGLEKAANCPSFNADLPFLFCKLGAGEFSAFLFLPRLPFPHSFSLLHSECNPWQWKVTSFLQHPRPTTPLLLLPSPSSTAYDIMSGCCGQPDSLDVTVKCSELPQTPSFSFPVWLGSSFLSRTYPLVFFFFPPCMTEVSPAGSSLDQFFSAVGRCSPPALACGWAGGKVGWQGHYLNCSICQGTAGKAATSVTHSGRGCCWPTRLG